MLYIKYSNRHIISKMLSTFNQLQETRWFSISFLRQKI